MIRLSALLLPVLLAGMGVMPAKAQAPIPERDSTTVSLFEYATKIPKRNNAFNLDLEMHAGFNADFLSGKPDEAAFGMKDIKVDISGEVNDRLFYWYRQKLNAGYENQPLENLSESIEYALIGYKLSDKFTLIAGKQEIFFGGYEYDENPLLIYEYSDINEYLPCYFTGLSLGYEASRSQEIRLQVTNSRLGSMEDDFGRLPDGIKKPKAPLYYTLNWNSSYLDELINLRYSVSAAQQAQGKYMYNFFAGQNIDAEPFYAYFDVMYSRGALDPLGLITELTPTDEEDEMPIRAKNCDYLSLVAEVQYRLHPKWKLFAKGMYETGSVYKSSEGLEKGKYRTAWGYQGGIEFYPMADDNLHIFLTATGRAYNLTEKAKALSASPENTARLSIGFIYRLPLY